MLVFRRWLRLLLPLLLPLAAPVWAQDDTPTVLDITYDSLVEDTITPNSFFDWWTVQATEGDILVIDMAASGGLEPLIGLLNPAGDLVARSDDGAPDGTVTLEFTAPASGQYTIVATRVGNEAGLSAGAYGLRLRRANPIQVDVSPYQEVTFICDDEAIGVYEAATAATLLISDDPQPDLSHRITVYGLDGFRPVIRIQFDQPQPYELCNLNADETLDDSFTLPGEETRAVTDLETVSQLIVNGAEQVGIITLTIGSKDGAPGRYLALVEGFTIDPKDDVDLIEARLGPLAAETTALRVYMVAAENSRLDPFMTLLPTEQTCDDAGRRGCEAVLSFDHAGAILHEGEGAVLAGDRADAGLLLNPGNPDPLVIELASRSADTYGDYALALIGELPPRE